MCTGLRWSRPRLRLTVTQPFGSSHPCQKGTPHPHTRFIQTNVNAVPSHALPVMGVVGRCFEDLLFRHANERDIGFGICYFGTQTKLTAVPSLLLPAMICVYGWVETCCILRAAIHESVPGGRIPCPADGFRAQRTESVLGGRMPSLTDGIRPCG